MGRFFVFLSTLLEMLAAGLTYLAGTLVVPNILGLAIWLLAEGGRGVFYLLSWGWLPHLPALPFPLSFSQLAHTRNRSCGLFWLGLYLLMRIRFLWQSPVLQKRAPANTLYPQEQRWHLIDGCIRHYQHNLTRFLTLPVRFKVPSTFRYEERAEGTIITWQSGAPVIPSSLLTPSMQPVLAPLLALELAKYHCADRFIRTWMSTYLLIRPGCNLAWFGAFCWLPMSLVHTKRYKMWCKQRELAYDEFAYLCGQGEALLQILRIQERNGLKVSATEYKPATAERIGHLEGLLHAEYEQMTRLGLAVPDLPGAPQLPAKHLLSGRQQGTSC